MKARQGVAENEISRRAYLYVARNQSLPAQVRYQAQLQLNTFGRYTRPTTVKNRCTATGRGRGVIGEFGLCRVRLSDGLNRECGLVTGAWAAQYQFRLKALAGELPGIHKASW
jgi:small subunit ribosomal protein S14